MLRILCQIVSVTLLGGCYLFHETGDERSSDERDFGLPPVADAAPPSRPDAFVPAPPLDAGFPVDAGPADLCPPRRAELLCLDYPLIPPRMPFTLPLRFTGCFCEERTTCQVRVDGNRIQVETGVCESLALCATCQPELEASCELPPLPRGVYQLDVNGSPGADLVVDFDTGFVTPTPACVMLQQGCSETSDISTHPDRFSSACVQGELERSWIELSDICGECPANDGTCTVTYEERLTDELPFGGEIRVEPNIEICGVGICEPSCEEHVRRCAIPERLMPGGFYRVWLPGDDGPSFSFTGGESTCD